MIGSRLGVISLVSAIAIAGWTVNVVAQERPLPPSAAPRPAPARARAAKPPAPVASPSVDVLLRRAHLSRALLERRKAATPSSAALAVSAPEPAEPRDRSTRAARRPPAAPTSPTTRELLDIVRRRPGGPELLERAQRGGARIPPLEHSNLEGSSIDGITHGPRVAEPEAGAISLVAISQATLVAKVTRNAPYINVAGLGTLSAEAYYPWYASNNLTVWGPFDRWSSSSSGNEVGGAWSVKSYVTMNLMAQSTGWYLINVVATPTGAEMRHAGSSGIFTLVQTFTQPTTNAFSYSSYPVVLNLAAGPHRFSWANLNYFPYVSEVSVTKL